MLRKIGELGARRIPGTERGIAPFFSPDGTQIGFTVADKLKRVPVTGGSATTVCDVPAAALTTASWSADDTIVFADPTDPPGVFRVSVSSGKRERMTTAAKGEIHSLPQLLPGGASLLFVAASGGRRRTVVRDLASGDEKVVLDDAAAHYVKTGYLLYANRDSVLMAAPFDARTRSVTAPAVSVQDGVMVKGGFAAANITAADDGTLIVVPLIAVGDKRHVMWATSDGRSVPALPGDPALDYPRYPSLSRDGQHLALTQGPARCHLGPDLQGGSQPRKPRSTRTTSARNGCPDKSILRVRSGVRAIFGRQ
jgi:serine/threonine-protein kinase